MAAKRYGGRFFIRSAYISFSPWMMHLYDCDYYWAGTTFT
jgi:hypothetical protein